MELVTFRLANYETPLWSVENFSAGRYNAADAGFTQYLSLHPLTPWAELLRNEDRRPRDRAILMRYPLWALRVLVDDDPFELTFDNAADYGLNPSDLVDDDHGPCRALAGAFRAGGPKAFMAPSAALPGTTNLIVLEAHVLASWNQVPLDEIDWPGSMTSQDGRCPEGLWDLVHYRGSGTRHPGLAAWEAGDPLVFEEPPVSASSLAP
jgi:RES domain